MLFLICIQVALISAQILLWLFNAKNLENVLPLKFYWTESKTCSISLFSFALTISSSKLEWFSIIWVAKPFQSHQYRAAFQDNIVLIS